MEPSYTVGNHIAKMYTEVYKDFMSLRNTVAHSLVELTARQLSRMKNNAIFVSQIFGTNGMQYDDIVYGKHIRCQRKKRIQCTNQASDVIDISQIKNNYVIIVAPKVQCLRVLPQLHIISVGELYQHCPHDKVSSGYVLLFIGRSNNNNSSVLQSWNEKDFKYLKRSKNNVIRKSNNHHCSVGHYFSFGNKAKFAIDDDSSIGTYASRQSSSNLTQTELCNIAKTFEHKCAMELNLAQENISEILPLNKLFVMPIVTAAHKGSVDINMKSPLYEPVSMQSGCWTSSICVNAETKELHNECDCTYTIITAPLQNHIISKYEFNFCLNTKNNVSINMNSGVTFMFSGLFLLHKQYKWFGEGKDLFYNFASYGNNRLFNHLKQTLNRY